jgi:Fe-S-cluster containining protein
MSYMRSGPLPPSMSAPSEGLQCAPQRPELDGSVLVAYINEAGHAESQRIGSDRIYFAFSSGRFGYDCVTCGAKCCRGFGYSLGSQAELASQLSRRPEVAVFLDRIGARGATVQNLPPGCFFLEGGRCQIHAGLGYAAKPETCRLFPFNRIRLLGDHLLIGPHLGLCPLQIAASDSPSKESQHKVLLDELARAGVSAEVSRAVCIGEPATAVLLERQIVALSERHLDRGDYLAFAEEQMAAADDVLQAPLAGTTDREGLARFQQHVSTLLGVPIPTNVGPECVRTLVAATPALRAEMLFKAPRRLAIDGPPAELDVVPRMLVVVDVLARLASAGGTCPVTYQTLFKMYLDMTPLIELLAYVDEPVMWDPGAEIEWLVNAREDVCYQYYAVVEALLRTPASGRSLGHILEEILCASSASRPRVLKELAYRLRGRLIRLGARASRAKQRTLKKRLQQWVLCVVSAEAVAARAVSASSRQRKRLLSAARGGGPAG